MNDFKLTLRSMLTLGSLIGFLVSWITLAHADKTIKSSDQSGVAAMPTLAPLPTTSRLSAPLNSGNLNVISPTEAPLPTAIPFPTMAPLQPVPAHRRHSVFTTGGS